MQNPKPKTLTRGNPNPNPNPNHKPYALRDTAIGLKMYINWVGT